jgi:hypothetical protein
MDDTPHGPAVSLCWVPAAPLLPLIVVLVIATVDAWIYNDAPAHRDRGRSVVVTIGSATIDEPESWLAACLVLSIVFIPLYFVARATA